MTNVTKKVRVLFVGGGSGGHFYPLIAIAEKMQQDLSYARLYYAGPDRYDKDALSVNSLRYIHIPAGKKRRYASILNFLDIFKTFFGLLVALFKLFFIYPDVIVSKGSYTSVPILLAARFYRIPIVMHESDAVFGKANKLALKAAHDVVVAYDEAFAAITHPRKHKLGIPIREALLQAPTPTAVSDLGIDSSRPLILILGGSQGAERVNNLVLDTLDDLLVDFDILHQTGNALHELCVLSADTLITDTALRSHYHPKPFLNDTELNNAYHVAALVISRAGSNSIYEIALHGKPAILIPIPEDVSHDQRTNAYSYARLGGAVVMEEKNLTDSLLRSEIDRIMLDTQIYSAMSTAAKSFATPDTAERMRELILDITSKH